MNTTINHLQGPLHERMTEHHKLNPTTNISEENDDRSIVLETVERIMKIKTEFANEDCEIFMPVWASETYLNILNNLVSKVEVKRKSPKEDTYKEETVIRHAQ